MAYFLHNVSQSQEGETVTRDYYYVLNCFLNQRKKLIYKEYISYTKG